jgi:serine/threonine-protein kinase
MMVTPSVRLVRPLGSGGMGAVWVAEHLALRTQVVVKFIASGLKSSREAQERFSREAAAASQVKSPHVVQTFDHGVTEGGVPYIVMELLEGRDLGEHLDLHGKPATEVVVEILSQLARALDRAHEKGIIHRDIKPANVFLTEAGRGGEVFVKLLDFGVAKRVTLEAGIDSGTKTGSMVGSPFYMSPEQILGSKSLDHRSDLWSLGVLSFEMLTGRKPFDAETMGGLAIRIHSEPLPVPSRVEASLPAEVDAWFERACARDVSARYATARELVEELARALGAQASRSLPPPLRLGDERGEAAVVTGQEATLAAVAGPDGGRLSGSTSGRSRQRSRLMILLGICVLGPPLAFLGVRAVRTSAPLSPPSPPSPPALAAQAASEDPSTTRGGLKASPASASPALVSSAASEVPAVPAVAVRSSGGPPRRTPSASHAAAQPLPLPPPAALPSSAPRPVASGHDIF